MKRDMDLIRWLLQQMEARKLPMSVRCETIIKDAEPECPYTADEIEYHARLLASAGLLEIDEEKGPRGNVRNLLGGSEFRVSQLTWEGHEFLEASRDQHRWESTKRWLAEKSGGLTFSLLQSLLLQKLREQLGIKE